MSSTTHQIVLTAADKTQQVFSAIEKGAKADVAALQQMGREGTTALTQVEQSATRAATGAETFNRAWTAIGAVAGTAAAALGGWSRSAQDAAAIQRQLEAAITASGASYATYASQIGAVGKQAIQFGQDDEAASQAIAALTEITGSASTAINDMGLVFDLAAAKGLSLESAAELIGKVTEGNTGILQRYGIVVQQGATAEQALAQIQAQVAGQAEAHATSYARLREELSNVTDAIGGTVGGFAPFLQMLPGLSVGVTAVSGAIGALVPEMEAAEVASAALDIALGPVGIALAAGAAVVSIYELVKAHHDEADAAKEAASATQDLETTIAQLASAGNPLASTADKWAADLKGALDAVQAQIDDTNAKFKAAENAPSGGTEAPVVDVDAVSALKAQLDALNAVEAESQQATDALNDILNDTGTGARQAQDAVAALFHQFAQTGDITTLVDGLIGLDGQLTEFDKRANVITDVVSKWSDATKLMNDEATLLGQYAHAMADNLGTGGAAADKFASDLQALAAAGDEDQIDFWFKALADQRLTLPQVEAAAAAAAGRQRELAAAEQASADATQAAADAEVSRSIGLDQMNTDSVQARLATEKHTKALDDQAAMLGIIAHESSAAGQAQHDYGDGAQAAADHSYDAVEANRALASTTIYLAENIKPTVEQLKQEAQSAYAAAQALGVLSTYAEQLRPIDLTPKGGDRATGIAAELQQAGGGLDSVLGIFKQIDALGQRQGDAEGIVEKLVGKPGELGEVDALLNRGLISLTRYNQTVAAGNDIMGRQAAIQDELAVIQARQLPLLDQQDAAYANYIDQLSHMSAAQQEVALGFMDTTEAAKAQQAVTLAASAAMGDLGDKGEEAASKIITGAAEADPVLAAMLNSIGLISTDHEGNIHVNFPNAKSLQGSIDGLSQSINDLTSALWVVDINGDASGALGAANDATNALNGVANGTWTATIGADASSFWDTVNGINGSVVGSAFIDVELTGSGVGSNPTQIGEQGGGGQVGGVTGMLVSMAGGGAVGGDHQYMSWNLIRANEGGRESATLPNGDNVMLPTGSITWPHGVAEAAGGKQRPQMNFYAPIHIYANNPQDFYQQMQGYGMAGR